MTPPPNRRSGLAPELRILLATVRGERAELEATLATPERRAGDVGPSWPRLLALAEREGATPFLRVQLARLEGGPPLLDDPGVAAEAHAALHRLALVHEFRLRELDRRLEALLPELHGAGIEGVLLKGAALRRTVYRSVIDRPMSDVDVLVGEEEAERAWEIAHDLGWRRRPNAPPDEAYTDHHHLAPMSDEAGIGIGLEIHTDLFPAPNPFRLSGSEVRRDARRVHERADVLVPSSEHALIHAAIHFAWSHSFSYGAWKTFRDIHTLLGSGSIEPATLVREAQLARAGACVYWSLRLAQDWAGITCDPEVLDALAPPGPEVVRRTLARHFARRLAPREDESLPPALSRGLWELAMRPVSEGYAHVRPWTGSAKWTAGRASVRPKAGERARRGLGAVRHLARVIAAR